MQKKYSQVISFIKQAGDSITDKAGDIEDIGIKKSWLTKYDIEIEEKLQKLVSSFGDDHKIYAEELNDEYIDGDHVWVADPISHTFAFIHGLPHYAVVVAHLHKGKTVFAAAYDPSVKELFVAEKNKGVTLNGEKVSVNKNIRDLCFIYDPQMPARRFSKEDRLNLLSDLMDKGRNKTFGSACLLYAYVACGRAHACVDMNKDAFTWIPGKLMVEEAGGKVTDFYGKKAKIETMGLVASNGVIHDEMVGITSKY